MSKGFYRWKAASYLKRISAKMADWGWSSTKERVSHLLSRFKMLFLHLFLKSNDAGDEMPFQTLHFERVGQNVCTVVLARSWLVLFLCGPNRIRRGLVFLFCTSKSHQHLLPFLNTNFNQPLHQSRFKRFMTSKGYEWNRYYYFEFDFWAYL